MALIKSIIKTLLVYYLLQSLFFFLCLRLWKTPGEPVFLIFLTVELVFYLAAFVFLAKNQKSFYRIRDGGREDSVNWATKITLFRITMLPFLVFLTLFSQWSSTRFGGVFVPGPVLTAAFALTFASDFFDGYIARTMGVETYIGKILDSASDYLLLGINAGAFFFLKILNPWLFAMIIGRLVFNSLVMLILFVVHKKLRPQTTPLGKVTIAVIMVLLVLETARFLGLPSLSLWIGYAERAAALVTGFSLIDKTVYLIRGLGFRAKEA
ncbi:MAG: CDP-alcohol phosphatidyltransferase family protein [Treponema sp.]|jgi:phosphatidylglycerophosphate synthase|nr:CDP-alcohol phosphatidyltransferase family protein [Treponema sp.]